MRGSGRLPRHCRSCGKRFHAKLEAIERDLAMREEGGKSGSGGFIETGF
jgi:hypothetical protein